MTSARLLPTVWIMHTADGWYPIQPSDRCRAEDHGKLNPHVLRIEDADGNVLWARNGAPQWVPAIISMADPGTVFPPRDEWDIAAYDTDDVVAGYREYCIADPAPGPNHSPAYRWGWANARRDATHIPDGYEPLRDAFIDMSRRPN